MDAMKLLGSLMKNQSLASGLGGNLLGSLLGGGGNQSSSGAAGLLGLLGGGGGQSGGGMLSGLLGSIMGGGQAEAAQAQAVAPPQEAQDNAALMIRAMVNASKSDGRIDQAEQDNIIGKLGEVSEAEKQFLRTEFAAPLDANAFAASIPKGMEQQIYAVSLMSIELDTQNEAQYLAQLGQQLNLTPQICNQIHEQIGAPVIFS